MELTKEQIEKRDYYRFKLKGRIGVITNIYSNENLKSGDKISIIAYYDQNETFKVVCKGREYLLNPDEFQLIDKEFSDFKILKKGIKVERKDKYGDRFIIELQNNKRDIYLSSSLVSLLGLKDNSYVGFASNAETGIYYIFETNETEGYKFDKSKGKITSSADWRELNTIWSNNYFEVSPTPIIDRDNPDSIFYGISPVFIEKEFIAPPAVKSLTKSNKKETPSSLSSYMDYFVFKEVEKVNSFENRAAVTQNTGLIKQIQEEPLKSILEEYEEPKNGNF